MKYKITRTNVDYKIEIFLDIDLKRHRMGFDYIDDKIMKIINNVTDEMDMSISLLEIKERQNDT